jgi:NAD(P)-dependent dehydrogenase (short-subunit alcohol dehydrogenase family)
MDLGLRGAAVVSGSTAGIGLAIVTALAAEGAKVVVNGRTEARVAAALDKIRQRVANTELRGVAADLGTANGVDAFLKQVTEADVLVNNLGIFELNLFAEISDAESFKIPPTRP